MMRLSNFLCIEHPQIRDRSRLARELLVGQRLSTDSGLVEHPQIRDRTALIRRDWRLEREKGVREENKNLRVSKNSTNQF